jgi:hypothetical protein
MTNKIPAGLKVLRAIAFLGLFISLIGLFALSTLLQNPLSLAFLMIGIFFYISLILAINKRSKTLFNTTYISLGILILSSFAFLIILNASNTVIRLLIEIVILVYLWKNKNYFSA